MTSKHFASLVNALVSIQEKSWIARDVRDWSYENDPDGDNACGLFWFNPSTDSDFVLTIPNDLKLSVMADHEGDGEDELMDSVFLNYLNTSSDTEQDKVYEIVRRFIEHCAGKWSRYQNRVVSKYQSS